MSTDFEQNLRVLTEHIDEIAARHVTAAGVLKVAGETVNDIGDRVSSTHGVACFASNSAVAEVEAARDSARKKLWQMSHDLGERLTMASANYNDADWRTANDIESCGLWVSDNAPWADDEVDGDVSSSSEYENSDLDHFDDFQPVDHGSEDDELNVFFTVSNPAGTIAVTALLGGRIQRVDLAPQISTSAESVLAEEISILSGLATQKALAAQHGVVSTLMQDMGHDGAVICDFLEREIGLPSPERHAADRASVFAEFYGKQ